MVIESPANEIIVVLLVWKGASHCSQRVCVQRCSGGPWRAVRRRRVRTCAGTQARGRSVSTEEDVELGDEGEQSWAERLRLGDGDRSAVGGRSMRLKNAEREKVDERLGYVCTPRAAQG